MSKEAMKLALEALEHCKDAIVERGLNGSPEFAEKWGLTLPLERSEEAITALRSALAEQPAQTATYTCGVCGVPMQMEKPAQPQQEPVAYMTQARNFMHPMEFTEAEAKLLGWKALYTSPPASKPLTDEQAMALTRGALNRLDVVRKTESAHGIKENT